MKLEIKEIDGVPGTGIPDGSKTVKGYMIPYSRNSKDESSDQY